MRRLVLTFLVVVLLGGCSSESGAEPDGGTVPGQDGTTSPGDSGVDAAPQMDAVVPVDGGGGSGCGNPVSGGDFTWTLTHGGRPRTFQVHVPAGYNPNTPTPVVVSFHGRNSNAQQQILLTGLPEVADAEGFVAVHPEGIGMTWNAGVCCGQAMDEVVDDVGFTAALLDRLEAELCIDTHRVFATGISNGGFMANRVGCDLSERIAAFSSVSGPNATLSCAPSRAVPLLHFHGTADTIVPYDGFGGALAVVSTIGDWVSRNSCSSQSTVFFQQAEVLCEEWTGCQDNATVQLCTITGGGHQWPGGFTIPGLGYNTNIIAATQMSWDFFEAHPLP